MASVSQCGDSQDFDPAGPSLFEENKGLLQWGEGMSYLVGKLLVLGNHSIRTDAKDYLSQIVCGTSQNSREF